MVATAFAEATATARSNAFVASTIACVVPVLLSAAATASSSAFWAATTVLSPATPWSVAFVSAVSAFVLAVSRSLLAATIASSSAFWAACTSAVVFVGSLEIVSKFEAADETADSWSYGDVSVTTTVIVFVVFKPVASVAVNVTVYVPGSSFTTSA